MPKIQLTHIDQESDPVILDTGIGVEVPVDFHDAFQDLDSDIDNLIRHHKIIFPPEYNTPREILFKQNFDLKTLYEHIERQHFELKNNRPWDNRHNLIYQRDAWLMFAMDAKVAAHIFAIHELINSAWSCLNIGTYHFARATMITEVDIRIQLIISNKQTRKSKEASNQITKNAKESLVALFRNNAPASGWKTLKIALHEIRKNLIDEVKAKEPTNGEQEIKKLVENVLPKIVNWMRTDLIFKAQIDRHIQNKTVPDLTHLE